MINTIFDYVFSFRFINFIWIITCFCYGIKKWIVPDLKTAIIDKKNSITIIKHSISQTQSQQKDLLDSIELQESVGKELFSKIMIWNEHNTKKNKLLEQNQRTMLHNYQHYRMTQYKSVELLYAQRLIQQDVWNVTIDHLKNMYSNQKDQDNFLKHVLSKNHEE